MDCRKCKKPLEADWPFCPYCGACQTPKPKSVKVRGNGSGSIYKRGKKYEARITTYIETIKTENGIKKKQHRKSLGTYSTKLEAQAAISAWYDNPVRNKAITFQALYEAWLPAYEPRVGKTTIDGHKAAYAYCKPLYGMKFNEIITADWQACIDACPKGKRTKENIKALATALYKYAIANDYASKSYAPYIYCGNDTEGKREPITTNELEKIRQAIGKVDYCDYIYCLCYLGFRPNEMLALKKTAYDQEHDCLIGGFKTEAGTDRVVTVSPKIKSILLKQLQGDSEYLFPRKDGSLMDDEHFRKYCFNPAMEALGIVGRVPYSCRHTYANLLKNVPGSDTDKAALMGHAHADMTKAYQSPDYESLKAITDRI